MKSMTIITVSQWVWIGALLCTSHVGALSQQQQLDKNRAKWKSFIGNTITSGYAMKYTHAGFLPPEYRGPFLVIVDSTGELASACYLEGSETEGECVDEPSTMFLLTVEDAFNLIQSALNQGVDVFNVVYDKVAGFPSEVFIDWSVAIQDEETSFTIGSLVLV